MKCMFNGVGEAFDELLPNCSVWLETAPAGQRRTVLLDCGFTAPFALFANLGAERALDLDMVWISHFHGDHFLGLPALLLRFWEEGRSRPLTIVGPEGIQEMTEKAMDLAYPGVRERFGFELRFQDAVPGATLLPLGLSLQTAPSDHPQPNLSLRISDGSRSVFYSGDGRPTAASQALARGVDLIIHESFSLEQDTQGHGTVPGSIAFAREADVARLALIHLRRDVRHGQREKVLQLMRDTHDIRVCLPEPGDRYDVGEDCRNQS